MRTTKSFHGPAYGLTVAMALAVVLPLPASAGPVDPSQDALASTAAFDGDTADASPETLAPSGDEAFSPDILTASTSLTARDLARETGERVEVLDLRTAATSTYALPDGSWQVAQSGAPQWAQTAGDGTDASDWENVDTRLVENGDGSYSPNAHIQEVVVNGGGGEFFRLSDPETGLDVSLSLGKGVVPAPLVDGPRATFADIARDTDLVVEIQPAGYEYFLVVKTPGAAAASNDLPLVFTMTGATMVPDEAGGFALVGDDGVVIGAMPPPVAWDAQSDLKRGTPVLDEWLPRQEFAPVTRALDSVAPADRVSMIRAFLASGDDLQSENLVDVSQVLTPTETPGAFDVELAVPGEWMDDPSTHYPIVLDPSWVGFASFDTFVQGGYTSNQSASTELKIGTYDSGSHKARSFLTFPWGDVQYSEVTSAKLYLWEWHSWSCLARGWTVSEADPANTSTRWTLQPWIGAVRGSSSTTKGFSSSCNDGWVAAGITSLAQEWSDDSSSTSHSIALRGSSETNNYYWKRFNSKEASGGDPYILLDYTTTPPKAPTNITVGGKTLTAAHRTEFESKRPDFEATVDDIDNPPTGGAVRNLHAVFVLYKDGVEVGSYDGTTVAPGEVSSYTPTFDLEEGANYSLYVATVFNATTVSTGIQGGGTFTTTSQQPAVPCGLRIDDEGVSTAEVAEDGTQATSSSRVVVCDPRQILGPGDVDGDGNNDMLVWESDGSLREYLGDGAGGFLSTSGSIVTGAWSPFIRIITPGDWDGDGNLDIVTEDTDGHLYLNPGDGHGAFGAASTYFGSGWAGKVVIVGVGDYDKDGNPDVLGMTSTGDVYLYRSNGSGTWISETRPHLASGWINVTDILTPGDFDHNSYDAVDFMPWTKSNGHLSLYYSMGSKSAPGNSGILSSAFGPYVQMVSPGDFTGDGYSDVVALTEAGQLLVFAGDGSDISDTGVETTFDAAVATPAEALSLGDSTPAFSAVVSDPDGGQVRAVFSLYRRRAGDAEWELVRDDLYGSWVTSGQRSYFRSTASSNDPGLEAALLAGNEYRIEVRSQDESRSSEKALTTGVLTVPPPGAAPEIPAGCDTDSGTPSGTSTTC